MQQIGSGNDPETGNKPETEALRAFGRLLNWHLERGTRPQGESEIEGARWTTKEFAAAVGNDERSVREWGAGKYPPKDLRPIERALLGDNAVYAEFRNELRQAYRRARSRNEIFDEGGDQKRNPLYNLQIVGLDQLKYIGWSVADVLDKIKELDYELYDNLSREIVGDTNQWLPIFTQHPETWRVLLSENMTLVGYWQMAVFFPDFYSKVKDGYSLEGDIRPENYDLMEIPGIYNLYFVSTCLHTNYRTPMARLKLMDAFFAVVDELSKSKVFFNEVTTNAYSVEGLQLSKAFGLTYLREHRYSGKIYTGKIGNLLDRYKGRLATHFPRLIERYQGMDLCDGTPARNDINPGEPKSNNSDHLVLLIHGFNTRAHWMNDVKPALQKRGFAVGATSFGDFGFVRFLSFPACREAAKERVLKGIRTAERIYREDNAENAPKKISVIAHSFGSWLFMRILCENPGLKFYRIILCGSILREDYDFDPVLHQFARPLLNHIGMRDYWPAIGESAGWGYGSIGTNGLNHPAAENRWHKDFHHSDFLTAEFCSKFWLPFLEGKDDSEPADKWQMLPLWVRAVTFLPLRWFILSLVIVASLSLGSLGQFLSLKLGGVDAASHIKKFIQTGFLRPAPRECAQINPQTGLPDNALEKRPCFPGRVVFVKYLDPTDYRMLAGAPPNPTGVWPIDRPNRALQLRGTTPRGQPQWMERDLVKVDGAVEEWGQQNHYWVEIIRGIRAGDTSSAFILRRVDLQAIPVGEGKSQCDLLKGKRDVLEFAIPEDAAIRLKSGAAPNVWLRWVMVECGKEIGFDPLDGPDFQRMSAQIVSVVSDENMSE